MRRIAWTGTALLIACGAGPGSTNDAADAQAALCEDEAWTARIEVLPAGLPPSRPFRVLGPVEARWDVTAAGRYSTLQQKACTLGADAVVGMTESSVGGGMSMGTISGGNLMLMNGGGHLVASGLAIAYTDRLVLIADGHGPPIVMPRAAPGGTR